METDIDDWTCVPDQPVKKLRWETPAIVPLPMDRTAASLLDGEDGGDNPEFVHS